MHKRLSPATVFLLAMPPLLWASNAVVGRLVHSLVSPMTLNFLRWSVALVAMLPLGWMVLRRGSPMWPRWRRYALLGLFGIGSYNALQYLALQTSQPLNVTLVGAGTPMWMLLVGRCCFGAPVRPAQAAGAVLSMVGVLVVLAHGSFDALFALRLVPGDAFMVLATVVWSFYSWLLVRPTADTDPLRHDWAAFLTAQIFFGTLWAGLFAGGEWAAGAAHVEIGWPVLAAVVYVGVFPAVIAFRSFNAGIDRVGPAFASFFINLTPLYAALLSAAFLGEMPHAYHAAAFALIVAGIAVSSRR